MPRPARRPGIGDQAHGDMNPSDKCDITAVPRASTATRVHRIEQVEKVREALWT